MDAPLVRGPVNRRDGEIPREGDGNAIDDEALAVALATMLDPEVGPKRAWLDLKGDFEAVMARMPAPPGKALEVPLGLASLPERDRLDLMEQVLGAQFQYLGTFYRWATLDLAAVIYKHLSHGQRERGVDLLNQPTDARIQFVARGVFHTEAEQVYALRDEAAVILGALPEAAQAVMHAALVEARRGTV